MTGERVALEAEPGGLARLRLAWPEGRNGIDPAMVAALAAAAAQLRHGDHRALLIDSEGPIFTVGGDLGYFATRTDDLAAALDAVIPTYHEALAILSELPLPVVAAVRGAAAGGGLGLVWCADIVLAADDARLAAGFARLGLTGDGGSSWWLPRLVGLRRAQALLIGGRVLDAQTALDWGLVTEVVPAADLPARALQVATELAAGPTRGLAGIRALLRESATRTLREQLAAESAAMSASGATADAVEGVRAFAERRPPRFSGS